MKVFRVQTGQAWPSLKPRYRYYATLDAAREFCNAQFKRRGVVLGIEEVTAPRGCQVRL